MKSIIDRFNSHNENLGWLMDPTSSVKVTHILHYYISPSPTKYINFIFSSWFPLLVFLQNSTILPFFPNSIANISIKLTHCAINIPKQCYYALLFLFLQNKLLIYYYCFLLVLAERSSKLKGTTTTFARKQQVKY